MSGTEIPAIDMETSPTYQYLLYEPTTRAALHQLRRCILAQGSFLSTVV